MRSNQYMPDTNRLSVLLSVILLTYACLPYIKIPESSFNLSIFNVYIEYSFNISMLVYFILSIFSAIGTDWLISDHPSKKRKQMYQHWLLPALTAWVIGFPLSTIQVGLEWWAIFAFGAILLTLVFISEYIAVDFKDQNFNIAAIGLTSVSLAMYLILIISIRNLDPRLYIIFPAITLPLFLISLRTFYLYSRGKTKISWAIAITIIIGQFIAGLHYLPLSARSFGIIAVAPSYALIRISVALENQQKKKLVFIEPIIVMSLLFIVAIIIQ